MPANPARPRHTRRGAQPTPPRRSPYARSFRRGEAEELEAMEPGLHAEIAMLRLAIARVFAMAEGEEMELASMLHWLETLSRAAQKIERLVRTQVSISGEANSTLEVLNQALAQVVDEWKSSPGSS